eukprot:366724-Prorocentrum_minimum.AAC.1
MGYTTVTRDGAGEGGVLQYCNTPTVTKRTDLAALSHPSTMHARPPPCAMQVPWPGRAPLLHPSVLHTPPPWARHRCSGPDRLTAGF